MSPPQKRFGIFLAIIGAAAYGTNPLFAKPLYDIGMSVDSVLFYRYFLATCFLGLIILARRKSFCVKLTELMPLAVNGILLSLSSLCLYMSYTLMDTGVASTILFVYPIIVASIMTTFFRERLTFSTVFSIITSLVGVTALCLTSHEGTPISREGVVYVFFSSLSYAVYMVLIQRTPSMNAMPSDKLTFYNLLFACPLYFARLNFGLDLNFPSITMTSNYAAACGMSTQTFCLVCIALIALLPSVLSFETTARAIQIIGPTPTSIFGALEPATAVVIGVVIFSESINIQKIIGIILVLVAVVVIAIRKEKS